MQSIYKIASVIATLVGIFAMLAGDYGAMMLNFIIAQLFIVQSKLEPTKE